MLVSIIIPCYNEELVIHKTYDRVKKVLIDNNIQHEVLFVNDGSHDKTLALLTEIATKDKTIKVISFSRNFGHQAAITCGINKCNGDVAIIIDGDLQDPPELFPEMIKRHLEEKANVIYMVRKVREGTSLWKKISYKIFYRLLRMLSEHEIPVDTGDFRLMDRQVINICNAYPERNKYVRGLISWSGFKQIPFEYKRDARADGEPKYTLVKLIKLASTGLLYFSKKPLRLALNVGLLSIFVGIILALYVFVSKYYGWAELVPGWSSILVSVVFFGGVQLLTIGVLGEYLGIVFEEVKQRPEYIIQDKLNMEE